MVDFLFALYDSNKIIPKVESRESFFSPRIDPLLRNLKNRQSINRDPRSDKSLPFILQKISLHIFLKFFISLSTILIHLPLLRWQKSIDELNE